MNYSKQQITEIIAGSISALQAKQPMLFQPDDDIAERAVSAAISAYFNPAFPDYDVNCEYNRMTDEYGMQIPKRIHRNPNDENPSSVYPDIIVHQQDNGENNLLVVEIKMQWKNGEKDDDYNKLIGYKKELNYGYALYLELGQNGIVEMSWF